MAEGRNAGPVGYSDRITDAAFQAASAGQSMQWRRALWSFIPLAALVGLYAMGAISGVLFIPLLLVLAVFALGPLLKSRRAKSDETYDGVIASVERREPVSAAAPQHIGTDVADRMILHTIRIRDAQGRVHTHERMGGLEDYRTYYRPGDAVRHHKGFDLPEKYDKRGDAQVVCIACGRLLSMDARRCTGCSAPLLK